MLTSLTGNGELKVQYCQTFPMMMWRVAPERRWCILSESWQVAVGSADLASGT
jgi:hypothetical protein